MERNRTKGIKFHVAGLLAVVAEWLAIGMIVALCTGCASVETTLKVEYRHDDIVASVQTQVVR